MIVTFYLVTFMLSVATTVCYFFKNRKLDTTYVIFQLMVNLICLGRFLISVSESLEMALMANNILYVGVIFCPLTSLFILADLCRVPLKKWYKEFLTGWGILNYCFVLTIGRNGLYYRSVILMHMPSFHYLEKTYGPAHILYPAYLTVLVVSLLAVMMTAFRNRNKIAKDMVITCSIFCVGITAIYVVEKVMHSKVDFNIFGYFLLSIYVLYITDRVSINDIQSNVIYAIERMKEYGYIGFDKKFRFIGASENVKKNFPEINETWVVDDPVPENDTELYRNLKGLLNAHRVETEKTIFVNGQYFQMSVSEMVFNGKRKLGYLVEFLDTTAENEYLNRIENYNETLRKEVNEKTESISKIKDMLVLGMASMVESRDNSTGGHIKRTSRGMKVFAEEIAKYTGEFHLSEDYIRMIEKAAPMHDLGKIAVSDTVLKKQGRYTEDEYNQMKAHSREGARIIEEILRGVESDEFVDLCENMAHYHHERWDGKGYPEGLSGTDIPMEARIMAFVDVFDALVSKRCYKDAYSYDRAFQIIEENLGSQFDPRLGKVFLECRPKLEELYNGFDLTRIV